MGYRELKNQEENKMKRLKRIFLFLFVFLLLALFIFSFFYPPDSWKYYFLLPDVDEREKGEMRVHFIDVGQGDCSLIELPDGKTMLVDGGGAKAEKTILRYMNALKINTIDYLLITHTDDDHCGGIAEIVRQKKILNAYLPGSLDVESGKYAEAYAELAREDCNLIVSNSTINLSKDGSTPYTLKFLYPYMDGVIEEDNEGSAVFWLDYMGVSFLFTGDASKEVEQALIFNDKAGLLSGVELSSTEILKVSHHGSAQASSFDFLSHLHLQTAIISCGKDNNYGHPHEGVLGLLEVAGADVYRTDEDGHIIVTVKQNGSYEVDTL